VSAGGPGPTTAELARAARDALGLLGTVPDVRESEVFVAANGQLLARLVYTSHIPSNGVDEPKSTASHGLGLRVVFEGPDGPRIGFGAEPSDLGLEGARRALAKARAGAVRDPAFVSLPKPGAERPTLGAYHDPRLMEVADEELVGAGWKVVSGALRTFMGSPRLAELARDQAPEEGIRRLGLSLGGDVTIIQERVAVASTHLREVETDESTLITASVTAMVETMDAKGSGWTTGTRLDHLTDEAGVDAAQNAVRAVGGERVPSGRYPVVFGPQPVTDLLSNLVLPALHASAFYASNTPFLGRWGKSVAASILSLYDHGALPGFAGSKRITCEGLPTGRTDLITRGALTGLLTNWYDTQRLLRDPEARGKLGTDPAEAARGLIPKNGFRSGTGGGRHFAVQPGSAPTNVFVEGTETTSLDELIGRIANGLYVGRIWYTYPINGLRAGDFTCTVVGDSYVIRDGRIVAPLQANTLRINDNVVALLGGVTGITTEAKGTMVWAADEVVYAPSIAVSGVQADAIGGFAGGP